MNRLKEIRLNKGFTLDELAQEVGLTRQGISWYESKSDHKMPFDTAMKISQVLGCSVIDLLGTENFRYEFNEEADKIILLKIIINELKDAKLKDNLLDIIDKKYLFLTSEDYYGTDQFGNINIYSNVPDNIKESYHEYQKVHGVLLNNRTYCDSNFCDNGILRQIRIDRDYTQKELAELTGLSLSTICKSETNSGVWPKPMTIAKLAKVYGMTYEELRYAMRVKKVY